MGLWYKAALLLATSFVAQVSSANTPSPPIPFFPEGDNFYFDLDPSHPLYEEMNAESNRLTANVPTRKSEMSSRSTCTENQFPVICGEYTVSPGQCITLNSPYYPENYDNNFRCFWKFMSTDDNELEMTCSDFQFARGKDYMNVTADGSNVVMYNKANVLSDPITTDGGFLEVYFHTNRKAKAKGFTCVVRSLGEETPGDGPPLSHPSCGQRKTRIINGQESQINEFPWQVWLVTSWDDGKAASCGGSIINEDWVVTAAHCIESTASVTSIRVTVGAHLRLQPEEHGGYNVYAASYLLHQQYQFPRNDIAVIQLQSSLTFTDTVGPACLAPRSWVNDDFVGDEVYISGWGQTEEGSGSQYLRYVQTTGVSKADCGSSYGTIDDMIMCTASTNVQKACYGDSGGPVTTPKDGRTFLVGLVSFGRSCTEAIPDGHCRVAYMIDWIEASTGLTFDI